MTDAKTFLVALGALTLLLAACPPEPPAPASGDYAFPHAEDFGQGPVHGKAWLASPEGCDTCHLQGKGGPEAEHCDRCHDQYPHVAGFDAPEMHGPAWREALGGCDTCHETGERRPAEVADSACRDCHLDYPHRVTWVRPEIHGPKVIEEGPEVCGECHGVDWNGTESVDGCLECHEHFPHPPGYDEPEAHGFADAGNQDKCATACHGEDFQVGTSGVSCYDCHEAYPHSPDYATLKHREDLAELGEDACLNCHEGGAGHPEPFSCVTTCHGGGS
jgi:hypothetical protein